MTADPRTARLTIAAIPAVAGASVLDLDSLPWMGEEAPIALKLLRVDPVAGEYSLYTRMDAGVVLPRHRHFGPVDAWTVSGRWHYREYEWIAGPGSYVHEPPGSTHTLEALEQVTVFFIVRGGLALLDAGGALLGYEDWETMRDRYLGFCRAMGLAEPRLLP